MGCLVRKDVWCEALADRLSLSADESGPSPVQSLVCCELTGWHDLQRDGEHEFRNEGCLTKLMN